MTEYVKREATEGASESADSSDTIAALATAQGASGIAVVRISGPRSLSLADRVFKCRPPLPSQRSSHTVVYGHVVDEQGRHIDEALLLVLRRPRSYTGEDSVELQCHGGRQCFAAVLRRVIDAGCRPAEPGEFTRRAFLNGRIDLLQAESVMDLVQAQSERSASIALEQLSGRLSKEINRIYDGIVAIAANLEASLDFPEEDLPELHLGDSSASIDLIHSSILSLITTYRSGHIVRDGMKAVIVGKPNAGKSTLFNALLGKDRAIVSEKPGTTRDTLEEGLVVDGVLIRLVDTAGLHDSNCEIEQEGMRRTFEQIQNADLVIHVFDMTTAFDIPQICQFYEERNTSFVLVGSKSDLCRGEYAHYSFPECVIQTCAVTGEGVSEVIAAVNKHCALFMDCSTDNSVIVSERHRLMLDQAAEHLDHARQVLDVEGESGVVLAGRDLRFAADRVGRITGREYSEDLLDSVFSRFCIGK